MPAPRGRRRSRRTPGSTEFTAGAEAYEEVPTRALAVYAHPDDAEVSCGGTLARWVSAGAEVHVVVVAKGEKGSADPGVDPVALAGERADEVAAASAALGLAGVELLGYPDGELDADPPALRAEVVALVRRLRPDTLVCPDPTAVFFGDGYVNHVDHRAVGWAALDAVAPAAASPLYHPGGGGAHQVGTVLLSGTLEPDVWVDIGDHLDAKVAALFCHRSQLADDADEWLGDFVRARAGDEGQRMGMDAAEAFRRIRLAR
jgi:LmbE family N-acetylglucosaminyl deacetylase